jgi:uncharacterized membrane protein YhiD involved in acid resistance
MAFKTPHPVLQFVAGMTLFCGGLVEYGRHNDAWSVGLIALGAVLLTISGVSLSITHLRDKIPPRN